VALRTAGGGVVLDVHNGAAVQVVLHLDGLRRPQVVQQHLHHKQAAHDYLMGTAQGAQGAGLPASAPVM
jgi:hypothetical protein